MATEQQAGHHDEAVEKPLTVLLYASDRGRRDSVRLALGRRIAADLPEIRVLEVATQPAALTTLEAGGVDVAVLDGEAVPGGMGLCRQIKHEILDGPPVLLLAARPDDAWLATWALADAIVAYPVDPIRLPSALADLVRRSTDVVAPSSEHPLMTDDTGVVAPTWPGLLTGLIRGEDQPSRSTAWAMEQILDGLTTPAQMAGFLVALRAKGETVEELTGLAETMIKFATRIELTGPALDIVGSGGDRAGTVNISTMAAVVAAAAGARVVKHGNRAASSACGSADLLEEFGLVLDLAPEQQQQVIATTGIGFLFAAHYHPAFRHAGPVRRELGVPTAFNFLGPLTNPAQPSAVAAGVADPRMAGLMAGVMAARGQQGLVFHGSDGLDELTTTTTSKLWLFGPGIPLTTTEFDPAAIGIPRARPADLVGGTPAINAKIAREVLSGVTGPVRDIVLLNAAAGLTAWDGPEPDRLVEQLGGNLQRVATAIDSGAAAARLEQWVSLSRSAAD